MDKRGPTSIFNVQPSIFGTLMVVFGRIQSRDTPYLLPTYTIDIFKIPNLTFKVKLFQVQVHFPSFAKAMDGQSDGRAISTSQNMDKNAPYFDIRCSAFNNRYFLPLLVFSTNNFAQRKSP
ncbi:hypothetical protein [Gelidibacter gilvus]|uniref:Uncharacterized protein n=1 Tax=Gelidibacter gilvus TaxID=59602 RepID=A0A4Q0XDJ4_9FLAO|nr:hypothetical protein [Gelidibacter gilvus]RXJ46012.1 hypothetical protein ESZ48_13035 [Gelidibacter gilvus]